MFQPFPDVLHLLLHAFGLLSLALGILKLLGESLDFFVVPDSEGLDEVEEEFSSVGGVFFFGLEDVFVVVDG